MPGKSVLLVEDEENLLVALKYNLTREGYDVYTASDGEAGYEHFTRVNPDLVILDVMLPLLDGFELCRLIRRDSDVPVMMLTARGEEIDRVVGLELGADDYVVKPFGMRELLARTRALLRRPRRSVGASDSDSAITSGNLEVDTARHVVAVGGVAIDLKPREFDLLVLLASSKGQAMSRDVILDRLWGQDYVGDHRTVDVHIHGLRRKIEDDPGRPRRITTVRGVGYRFEE